MTKSHTGTFLRFGTGEWDVTISNGGLGPTSGTTTMTDTLPTGFNVASFTGTDASWSCIGISTNTPTCTSMSAVNSGSSFPTIKITVNVPGTAPSTVSNTANAYGGGDANHVDAAHEAVSNQDTFSPQSPQTPTFTKTFGSSTINQGDTVPVTLTITNPNSIPLTGLAFNDTLPSGLAVASPNGLSNTCGGTPTAVPGSGALSLSGGTVASSLTCTIVVNVTRQTPGDQTNPSVMLTSNEAAVTSSPVTVYVYAWWLTFFY